MYVPYPVTPARSRWTVALPKNVLFARPPTRSQKVQTFRHVWRSPFDRGGVSTALLVNFDATLKKSIREPSLMFFFFCVLAVQTCVPAEQPFGSTLSDPKPCRIMDWTANA